MNRCFSPFFIKTTFLLADFTVLSKQIDLLSISQNLAESRHSFDSEPDFIQPSHWFTGELNTNSYIWASEILSWSDSETLCREKYNATLWCPYSDDNIQLDTAESLEEQKQVVANLFQDSYEKSINSGNLGEDSDKFDGSFTLDKIIRNGGLKMWTGLQHTAVFDQLGNIVGGYTCSASTSKSSLSAYQDPGSRAFHSAYNFPEMELPASQKCVALELAYTTPARNVPPSVNLVFRHHDCESQNEILPHKKPEKIRPVCVKTALNQDSKTLDLKLFENLTEQLDIAFEKAISRFVTMVFIHMVVWIFCVTGCCFCCCCCCNCFEACRMDPEDTNSEFTPYEGPEFDARFSESQQQLVRMAVSGNDVQLNYDTQVLPRYEAHPYGDKPPPYAEINENMS